MHRFNPILRSAMAASLCVFAIATMAPARANNEAIGHVVLYTTLNSQSVETATDLGRKALPGIKLSAVTGGSAQLLKRMDTEAAKPRGDVFWTSTANLMERHSALFEPYESPEAAAVPAELRHPGKLWVAANMHVVVAMLNTKQLPGPAPQTWADLTDPGFKGKIVIADPGNSSTAFTALWGIEQLLGADGLKKIAANVTVSSAAFDVVRSVGQGEYAVGITYESSAYPYVAGGQREIRLLYPSDGTFSVPDNMALVKGAPNAAGARRVYDFLLSREVQIGLLENAFRRPSRSDIDVGRHVDMPPLAGIKIVPMDEAKAAADREGFMQRWRAHLAAAAKS